MTVDDRALVVEQLQSAYIMHADLVKQVMYLESQGVKGIDELGARFGSIENSLKKMLDDYELPHSI